MLIEVYKLCNLAYYNLGELAAQREDLLHIAKPMGSSINLELRVNSVYSTCGPAQLLVLLKASCE